MSGLAVVYLVFAITLASLIGYLLLLNRRERELEIERQALKEALSTIHDKKGNPSS